MSMVGYFVSVPSDQLASLIAAPDAVSSALDPGSPDSSSRKYMDVDQSWQAIHYTLNGDPWSGEAPLGLVVLGGEDIGEDMGYGPARYLTATQVQDVAAALDAIDPTAFGSRFDGQALDNADVHPQMWGEDPAEGLDYALHHYSQLRTFYQTAAQRGDAMLLYLG